MIEKVMLRLWAKTGQDSANCQYHPLLCHMLDVAAVASLVWDHQLTSKIRIRLECALGTQARSQVVFSSGAHDIGKASPGFQKRVPELSQCLGLQFSENDQNRPHGFISAHVLNQVLGPCSASALLGQISGGHHGVFPRSSELQMGQDTLGNTDWRAARYTLLNEFANIVGLDLKQAPQPKDEVTDPFIVPLLAGFISVVDWIGSNQDFFPCAAECGKQVEISAAEYWSKAQEQAGEALEKLGWLPGVTFARETQFGGVFPSLTPNNLQKTVVKLASKQTSPYLIIVEAPMGQGKTEAALYAADLAMSRGFSRGMYIAMPTQATGNAMFRRVLDDYLKHRGHQGKLNLQLVHGDALLAQLAKVKEGEIPAFEPRNINSNDNGGDTEAQSWFTAKKRPLLAPFGVGTIDQSLLSVLQTRHWFVRLFGLAGKVVIFDEVHAYDAYTSTILERLLHWLAEMDCTVIILSATLPEAKRRALISAYSGRNDAEYKRYPRITLAQARQYPNGQVAQVPVCEEVAMGDTRGINLHFTKTDLESPAAVLAQRLEHGGCAAVICNTVDRSIEVYKHLLDNLQETECLLFHARTLQMWRRKREEEVLSKFGKGEKQANGMYTNPHRPMRAVLVATQVIEQSLDLDFDIMVSEIAPVDLLLQRLGRLHRHPRLRPQGLEIPEFIVLCDAEREGSPPKTFGKSIEYIYDRYILLRTWLALRERDTIEVPTEIEELVEIVYGQSVLPVGDDWLGTLEKAKGKMASEQTESEKAASRLLVLKPGDPGDLIEQFNNELIDEEEPEVHQAVRAATREGNPSITVIMADVNTVLTPGPTVVEVRDLLDRSAKLSHQGIYHVLVTDGVIPEEWAKNAHLRHTRLLRLDGQNQCLVDGFVLTVDEKLGIVIEKESKDNG
jgi:CRISPR-associated endonuclease/helicase Cas3